MMLHKILLALILIGAAQGAIESTGFYPVHLPQSESTGISQAQVTDLSNSASSTPANYFSGFVVLAMFAHILLSMATTIITIVPLLTSYGVPLILAVFLQAPVTFVEVWGAYQMYTGHVTQMMD